MNKYRNGLKPTLGLIGTIGAGKSVAAQILAQKSGWIINADQLGHLAIEDNTVKVKLIERWTKKILHQDGRINRREVSAIVFADVKEREVLESLVFPIIGMLAHEKIKEGQNNQAIRFIVLDAAVLIEAGWKDMVDRLLFIDAERSIRVTRVAQRNGWTENELASREKSQMDINDKRQLADACLLNNGSITDLEQQIEKLLMTWSW
jgi:dephospho-CoA kinase